MKYLLIVPIAVVIVGSVWLASAFPNVWLVLLVPITLICFALTHLLVPNESRVNRGGCKEFVEPGTKIEKGQFKIIGGIR